MLSLFSRVELFAVLWTVARQATLSMGFSRQEYWSGLPCLSPGDRPDPGMEPASFSSPTGAGKFFTTSATWQWHPTPVLLPGKSHGRRSLVGCSPWGRWGSDSSERLHFHFHALEKEMATHSSVLAWRIPGMREPGGLTSMELNRVGDGWSDLTAAAPPGKSTEKNDGESVLANH